jgi:hypothetical protein
METKVCSECGKIKDISNFRHSNYIYKGIRKTSIRNKCKSCCHTKQRDWYQLKIHDIGWHENKKSKSRDAYRRGADLNIRWFKNNWKTAPVINKFTDKKGYVVLYFSNNGFHHTLYEHRYKISVKLGRLLRRDEEVHHKNGNKTDNRIENLELIDHVGHYPKYRLLLKTIAQQDQEITRLKELLSQKEEQCSTLPQR